MVKGILIKEVNGDPSEGVSVETLSGDLEDYYRALDCSYIDIVSLKIGPHTVDLILDDEGLLNRRLPLVFDSEGHPLYVGSVFVCSVDEDGREADLPDDAMSYILGECMGYYSYEAETDSGERELRRQSCLIGVAE